MNYDLINDIFIKYLPNENKIEFINKFNNLNNDDSLFKTIHESIIIGCGSYSEVYILNNDKDYVYKKLKAPYLMNNLIKETFLYYYFYKKNVGPEIKEIFLKKNKDSFNEKKFDNILNEIINKNININQYLDDIINKLISNNYLIDLLNQLIDIIKKNNVQNYFIIQQKIYNQNNSILLDNIENININYIYNLISNINLDNDNLKNKIKEDIYFIEYTETLNIYKYDLIIKLKKYKSNLKEYINTELILDNVNLFFEKINLIIDKIFNLEIIPTDIKFENFLIDNENNIVINDFDIIRCLSLKNDNIFSNFGLNKENVYNLDELYKIKELYKTYLFLRLIYLSIKNPCTKLIFNRNIKNFVYTNHLNFNINKLELLSYNNYNSIYELYEFSRHFFLTINFLSNCFNFSSNIKIRINLLSLKEIDNDIFIDELNNIVVYLIGKFKKQSNFNNELIIINKSLYNIIYDFDSFNKHYLSTSSTPTTLSMPSSPKLQSIPTTPSSVSSVLSNKIIKVFKKNIKKKNAIVEYELYKCLENLDVGIEVHDIIFINSDKFIKKYGIVMERYDGNLKDYIIEYVNIKKIEEKINNIINVLIKNGYYCGDLKFKNFLFKKNLENNEIIIKITNFNGIYYYNNKKRKNIDNYDKLLKLTLCMQHISYLCNLSVDNKINLLSDIFLGKEYNLKILFIDDLIQDNIHLYYFENLIDNNYKWLINLVKSIDIGIKNYNGIEYQERNIKEFLIKTENISNIKAIIHDAIDIIYEIKH